MTQHIDIQMKRGNGHYFSQAIDFSKARVAKRSGRVLILHLALQTSDVPFSFFHKSVDVITIAYVGVLDLWKISCSYHKIKKKSRIQKTDQNPRSLPSIAPKSPIRPQIPGIVFDSLACSIAFKTDP